MIRMVRVIDGPHAGREAIVPYAGYWPLINYQGIVVPYERQDPPVEVDGVWWHHYALPVRGTA